MVERCAVSRKVAFITGAARGQGRAFALRLAEAGMDIAAVDVCTDIEGVSYSLATEADLAGTIAGVEAAGGRALSLRADVRDPQALADAADRTVEELGGIDVVVANAGVFAAAKTWETDPATYRAVIDVNLDGAWNTAQATVPHLRERGSGAMIFVSSIAEHPRQRRLPQQRGHRHPAQRVDVPALPAGGRTRRGLAT